MFENLPPAFRPSLELPRETRATCENCVMAKPDWPRDARDPGPFAPGLKCCTYLPFLPNFTIGKLLKAGGHEASLKTAAQMGQLTPLGLLPEQMALTHSNTGLTEFGKNEKARCPFLSEKVSCTIWSERPSVCRSYFCVSDDGAAGQSRWQTAEAKGNELEWTLANQILWELGFTTEEAEANEWTEWKGRELEFFNACAELSETLSPLD